MVRFAAVTLSHMEVNLAIVSARPHSPSIVTTIHAIAERIVPLLGDWLGGEKPESGEAAKRSSALYRIGPSPGPYTARLMQGGLGLQFVPSCHALLGGGGNLQYRPKFSLAPPGGGGVQTPQPPLHCSRIFGGYGPMVHKLTAHE